jgi:hypothetical protein
MECRLSVGWCWSVSAGNVYEQSDKINLKVEEKKMRKANKTKIPTRKHSLISDELGQSVAQGITESKETENV